VHAAQEDRAALAPHTEFMTAGQIAVEPVPHGRSFALDAGFGWPPYGKSDAARFGHRATAFEIADRPATIFVFLSTSLRSDRARGEFGCVPRLHTKSDVAHAFVRSTRHRGVDGAAIQAMPM